MKLPTRAECFDLLKKYKVLPNILEHSIVVNKIANYLAKRLKEKGIKIDLNVVDRASLLHDIGKSILIINEPQKARTAEDSHHITGEEILVKEGYPELGLVCRRHSLKELHNINRWEEKVVKYADVRVKHTEIVGVKERMADLQKRYKVKKEEMVSVSEVLKLEKEIYNIIDESPDSLKDVI